MNKAPDHEALQRFYVEGQSWGADRLAANDRSKRVAWWVAGAAVGVIVLQAIALAAMLPLKTVVPYTVLVDRQTGYVTTVDPTKSIEIAPDAALTRSMLAQYVMAREEVDRATVRTAYRKVVLWSEGSAKRAYLAQMAPQSGRNPFQQLPAGVFVRAEVRSVSSLEPGLGMVRFDRITEAPNGNITSLPYVATMRFAFRTRQLTESDRFINPLGFAVSSYRVDAEAPASPLAPVGAGSGPSLGVTSQDQTELRR